MASVLSGYGWALWLATPILATTTASIVTWWRGRANSASPERAAQQHQRYLDALGRATARPTGGPRDDRTTDPV